MIGRSRLIMAAALSCLVASMSAGAVSAAGSAVKKLSVIDWPSLTYGFRDNGCSTGGATIIVINDTSQNVNAVICKQHRNDPGQFAKETIPPGRFDLGCITDLTQFSVHWEAPPSFAAPDDVTDPMSSVIAVTGTNESTCDPSLPACHWFIRNANPVKTVHVSYTQAGQTDVLIIGPNDRGYVLGRPGKAAPVINSAKYEQPYIAGQCLLHGE